MGHHVWRGAHAGQRQQPPGISASIRISLYKIHEPIETKMMIPHQLFGAFVAAAMDID